MSKKNFLTPLFHQYRVTNFLTKAADPPVFPAGTVIMGHPHHYEIGGQVQFTEVEDDGSCPTESPEKLPPPPAPTPPPTPRDWAGRDPSLLVLKTAVPAVTEYDSDPEFSFSANDDEASLGAAVNGDRVASRDVDRSWTLEYDGVVVWSSDDEQKQLMADQWVSVSLDAKKLVLTMAVCWSEDYPNVSRVERFVVGAEGILKPIPIMKSAAKSDDY